MVSGVITVRSGYSHEITLNRFVSIIADHGLTLFTNIDQQAAARSVGMQMPCGNLLLFGSPLLGTQILLQRPEAGVDLPLRIYIWEDSLGGVFVSYPDPENVASRDNLTKSLAKPLLAIVSLVNKVLEKD